MRTLLILNPGSRSGTRRKLWKTWKEGLLAEGFQVDAVQTVSLNHAFTLAGKAQGYDAVIASGGDGTINQVLDGVIQSGAGHLKLGVLYSGTSPDFCTFHNIPTEPGKALDAIIRGQTRRVDAVRVSLRDASGAQRVAHFACSCNIGMGAAVARRANRWRKCLGDTMGTGAAVLYGIVENPRVDLKLFLDGEKHLLRDTNNLFVLKNPHIASGLRLNYPLAADDGKLLVVGIHGKGRLQLLSVLPKLYSGEAGKTPGLFIRECARVEIYAEQQQEAEFDGDPRGWLPVKIEIIPKAIRLIGSR